MKVEVEVASYMHTLSRIWKYLSTVVHAEPFPVLVPLIKEFVRAGAEMYICTKIRQGTTFAAFLQLVRDTGLRAEKVADRSRESLPVQFLECLSLHQQHQHLVVHRICCSAA